MSSNATILVVEDEAPVRAMIRAFLKEFGGFKIVSARNTIEAEAQMKDHPIQVVVSDIQMPGEDGLSFLKRMKSLYPLTPVIILTAQDEDPELKQTAIENGATDYLSKINSMEHLVTAIKNSLRVKLSF